MFPLVFIYPEFGQFDYVERNPGDESLIGAFTEIFEAGLPWDNHGFYKNASKLVFAIKLNSSTTTMKKPEGWNIKDDYVFIGQDTSILKAVQTNGYVVPSIPEIYVLSAASPYFNVFRKEHSV